MSSKGWKWAFLGVLCWAIVSTGLVGYYYASYRNASTLYTQALSKLEEVSVTVSICIDYGNGTVEWHNGTVVPLGATLFNATLEVASVNYTVWNFSGYGYPNDKAVFVDAINGVWNDYEAGRFWQWYYWNGSEWVLGPVGCNHPDATVRDGGIYMWRYEEMA